MASEEFESAIKGETRRTSAEVIFELLDTTASSDASVSVVDKRADVSRENDIIEARDYQTKKFTTLENNYFGLNGKNYLTPRNTENVSVHVGWLSDTLSNASGVFTNPPCITFNFTQVHSSIGLSLEFDQEYPTSLTIVYYGIGGTELSRKTIANNKTKLNYSEQVQNYNKIEIYFNSTKNPYRRARLYSIIFGIIQDYTDEELLEFNLTRETSLASDKTIPISTCDFTINNINRDFNIINPSGVYDFLQEKQLIKTKLGVYLEDGNVEYVNTGKYYLSDWKTDGIKATLTANDKLSFSTTSYQSASSTTKTLRQWATDILTAMGFTDSDVSAVPTTSVTTRFDLMDGKELLKCIAQVSNTMLYVTTDDVITFKPIPSTKENDIDFDNMYKEPMITLDSKYNQVDVKVWQYGVSPESQTTISTHNWIAGDEVYTFQIDNNPFITTSSIAGDVGANILALLSNRIQYEIDWRQNPSIDIDAIVQIEDGFNENKFGVITKNSYKYSGYLSGNTSARGITLNE